MIVSYRFQKLGCHGRTASYPTAPAQIPACGTTALGSSEILASVKDTLVLPSLLFLAERFAFVPPVQQSGKCFLCRLGILSAPSSICYGYPFQCNGMGGWLDLTQQGLSPCKKYKTSWRVFR